jgi:LysR family glycine cleavage system transcriptional activator
MSRDLLPPLAALRAFEAVARRLSFKAAADELSVTPTAVSHHIRNLEQHVGVRLLDRTPRSCQLTSEGSVLFEATTSGFSDIRQAVTRLRRNGPKSPLTLSATPAFLSLWLVPRMRELEKQFHNLDLRLHASKAAISFEETGIDIAIRYGEKMPSAADSVFLCEDEFTPVCSPALGLRDPRDLCRSRLLHVDGYRVPRPAPTWKRWCSQAKVENIDTEAGPRFSDSLQAIQAAMAGQGVAIASSVIVRDALSSGALVRPFKEAIKGARYYFACPAAISTRQDVQALQAWFQRSLAAAG